MKKSNNNHFISELIDDINFYKTLPIDFTSDEVKSVKVFENKIVTIESVNKFLKSMEQDAKSLLEKELSLINGEITVNVAVIGDFSCGKSSFINSLLGKKICPVAINPTTSSITKFIYSDKPNITILNENRTISQKEYENLSQHNDSKKSCSYEIEYAYPFEKFQNITLFDTPGFNNNQNKYDEMITLKYATQADVIIFIVDINKGAIADDIVKKITYIKENSNNQQWHLVINQADTKSSLAADKILNSLKSEHFDFFDDVFLYSAKETLNSLIIDNTLDVVTKSISDELISKMDKKADFEFIIKGKKESRAGTLFSISIEDENIKLSNPKVVYSQVKDEIVELLNKTVQMKNIANNDRHCQNIYFYKKSRLELIEQLDSLKRNNESKFDDFLDLESSLLIKLNNLIDYAPLKSFVQSNLEIKIFNHNLANSFKYGFDDSRVQIVDDKRINSNFSQYKKLIEEGLYEIGKELEHYDFLSFNSYINFELTKLSKSIITKLHDGLENMQFKDDTKIRSEENLYIAVAVLTTEIKMLLEQSIIGKYNERLLMHRLTIVADLRNSENKYADLKMKLLDFKDQKHTVKFQLRPNKNYKKVFLTGSFNNWKVDGISLEKVGVFFEADMELIKGRYTYRFVVDSKYICDSNSIEKINEGTSNVQSIVYI